MYRYFLDVNSASICDDWFPYYYHLRIDFHESFNVRMQNHRGEYTYMYICSIYIYIYMYIFSRIFKSQCCFHESLIMLSFWYSFIFIIFVFFFYLFISTYVHVLHVLLIKYLFKIEQYLYINIFYTMNELEGK